MGVLLDLDYLRVVSFDIAVFPLTNPFRVQFRCYGRIALGRRIEGRVIFVQYGTRKLCLKLTKEKVLALKPRL